MSAPNYRLVNCCKNCKFWNRFSKYCNRHQEDNPMAICDDWKEELDDIE